MGKYFVGFLMAAVVLATASLPAVAQRNSTVVVYNLSDAWAWVTAYSSGTIQGAWCIDPGKASHRAFTYGITRLRVEVTHKGCAHPVMLDRDVNPKSNTFSSGYLRGEKGRYTWSPQ